MSSGPPSTRSGHRPTWRSAWLLGALLLGIIGMHGLSPHGAVGAGHDLHLVTAATATHPGAPPPMTAMAAATIDRASPRTSVASGPISDGMGGGMEEVCVAVLIGFAVLLLVARGVGGRADSLLPAPPCRRGPPPLHRILRPPSLEQLSLMRC